ncbi:sigma 54-interacting transcriptional regulator [Methylicorpusculum sp.]|uniref:sigma 54-interacting transcriptional regulator n=1 Tax=Methylicorpusculum sp. TaxID=2713644 RepID=UPI00271CE5A8|nr:sigma 54-interacting transcriptional regulator [Methylicorpusculum sp.]MDO8842728.1 sigma 54-interacting transcriptional regulator [Methylicorpusculum sp.]
MNKLNSEQYAVFAKIAALAFVNPFSFEREQANWQVLNLPPQALSAVERRKLVVEAINSQFLALSRQQRFDIRHFQGKTQAMMQLAWLVKVFYSYQPGFDEFIKAQQQAGDKALVLPFAQALSEEFELAGFTRQQASHSIALLFQLQRAFRFIDETVSGTSSAIVELRTRLWNNIFTFNPEWYLNYLCKRMEDFSLLLLGETGTGKSRVAKAIGCSGYIPFDALTGKFVESFTVSFRAINLSQYSPGVLESELFGHKKGAFTGAVDNHPGLFAHCSKHGSVFIDEIGELDIPIQVKLLNVLQDRLYSPVGSHEQRRFEGRIISATNRPIEQLMASGHFRKDFYYRLCSDVITLPNLKERLSQNPDELRALIASLVHRVIDSPEAELIDRIETRIREVVPKTYHWPGNVRELEQCIRRICITGSYQVNSLPSVTQANERIVQTDAQGKYLSAQQLLQNYCRFLFDQHNSYEAVARIAGLDRRTVKKYIDLSERGLQ